MNLRRVAGTPGASGGHCKRYRILIVLATVVLAIPAAVWAAPLAVAATGAVTPTTNGRSPLPPLPRTTVSRYELTSNSSALSGQGEADGKADLSGATVLDFGRPAAQTVGMPGTLDFGGHLDPLSGVIS